MKLILSRMNAKKLFASLAIMLALANCSSKQGAENAATDDAAASQMQAEEDMMLGEGEASEEVAAVGSGSEEVAAIAAPADESLDESGATTIEALPDGSPSLPVGSANDGALEVSKGARSDWKGSLKSTYEAGMTEWTVGRGESLSLIAEAVFGHASDWKKLAKLNPELSNPNSLTPGQKLRLTAGEAVAQADLGDEPAQEVVAEKAQSSSQAEAAPTMPVVSNTDPSAAESSSSEAAAPGAMGTVDAAPPADPTPAAGEGQLTGMVQKVDLGGNKLKLRNILLGVAAFFLLLSGLIFVLSRRKARAG